MTGITPLPFSEIFVYDQTYMFLRIKNQPHRRYRARTYMEVFFHHFRRRERQPGTPDLRRKILGFKRLIGRQHKQKELRLLPIGKTQIFKSRNSQLIAHSGTLFHRKCSPVAIRHIIHPKLIQKIIYSQFRIAAGIVSISRTSFINSSLIHIP